MIIISGIALFILALSIFIVYISSQPYFVKLSNMDCYDIKKSPLYGYMYAICGSQNSNIGNLYQLYSSPNAPVSQKFTIYQVTSYLDMQSHSAVFVDQYNHCERVFTLLQTYQSPVPWVLDGSSYCVNSGSSFSESVLHQDGQNPAGLSITSAGNGFLYVLITNVTKPGIYLYHPDTNFLQFTWPLANIVCVDLTFDTTSKYLFVLCPAVGIIMFNTQNQTVNASIVLYSLLNYGNRSFFNNIMTIVGPHLLIGSSSHGIIDIDITSLQLDNSHNISTLFNISTIIASECVYVTSLSISPETNQILVGCRDKGVISLNYRNLSNFTIIISNSVCNSVGYGLIFDNSTNSVYFSCNGHLYGYLSQPLSCNPGFYANYSVLQCLQCDIGHYCQNNTMYICDAGYICSVTGLHSPNFIAAPGYYAVPGSFAMSLCPSGFFCPFPGTSTPSPCILSHYCANGTITDNTTCLDGYECITPATQIPCAAGYACTLGVKSVCQNGTYSSSPLSNHCDVCPGGYFCSGSATVVPVLCPIYHYCVSGSSNASLCHLDVMNLCNVQGLASEPQLISSTNIISSTNGSNYTYFIITTGIGIIIFIIKLLLEYLARRFLDRVFEKEYTDPLFKEYVEKCIKPMVLAIFKRIKTTSFLGFRSYTKTQRYVEAIQLILTQIFDKNVPGSFLSELKPQKRLLVINTIVKVFDCKLGRHGKFFSIQQCKSIFLPDAEPADFDNASEFIVQKILSKMQELEQQKFIDSVELTINPVYSNSISVSSNV